MLAAGVLLVHVATAGHRPLIAALAVAMGMQSAAVRKLGGMSTTYLTGTLTSVIAGLVTRDRPSGFARSVGVLVAIVPGAVAGSLVAQYAPAWLPAVASASARQASLAEAISMAASRSRTWNFS